MVSTNCVIHRQTLASKILLQKFRLFTLLCKDLDSDHKVLFHTYAGYPKATCWLAFVN
nr:unnamed protein product [Callosobruchus analis]